MGTTKTLVEYQHDDVLLEGVFFQPEGAAKGTVLLTHAWAGRNEFVEEKAEFLAEQGFNSFALDMYGKGIRGNNPEENEALMMPLVENRELLQSRQLAALETVKKQPGVDAGKIAALGYCFGGLCSLDLARIGADVLGVISFHGLLFPPGNTAGNKIKAKVLVLHGYDDPMAPPEQVTDLATELTEMEADWQIHAYGNTLHAFTLPEANAPDMGTMYDKTADQRSWIAAMNFLDELF